MVAQCANWILVARILAPKPCLSHMPAVIQDRIIATATPGRGLATNNEDPNAVAAWCRLLVPQELCEDAAQTIEQDVLVDRLVAEVEPWLPVLQRRGQSPVFVLFCDDLVAE